MAIYPSDRDSDRREVTRYPFEITVDILCGGHKQKCRTADVSLDGAFVCTEELYAINQIVRVQAYAPNVKRPIEWMGRVTRVVTPKQATTTEPTGLAIKIFGIADKERIRWNDIIARASQGCEEDFDPRVRRKSGPNESVPSRMHVRYRTPLMIDIRDIKRLFRFVARDISAGGVFVPTKQKLDEGSDVSIVIRHPMSGETFEIDGEVIRSEADGLAVQFQGISPQQRKDLQRFIVSGRSRF